MKLIWLKATHVDLELMTRWFHEAQHEMDRVPKPPVLPEKKRREILENFPCMRVEKDREQAASGRGGEDDGNNGISLAELIESGLATEPTASELWHEYNEEGAYRI